MIHELQLKRSGFLVSKVWDKTIEDFSTKHRDEYELKAYYKYTQPLARMSNKEEFSETEKKLAYEFVENLKDNELFFEDYFGMEFPSCWPGWLNGLELDGYCEELDIAFEYNGEQHYKYIPYFHNKGRTLEMQQLRDKQKAEI